MQSSVRELNRTGWVVATGKGNVIEAKEESLKQEIEFQQHGISLEMKDCINTVSEEWEMG